MNLRLHFVVTVMVMLCAAQALGDEVPGSGGSGSSRASPPPDLSLSLRSSASTSEAVELAPEAGWHGFSFRLGALFLAPLGSSQQVELSNVQGPARLGVSNGPIEGSGVGMSSALMPAVTVGWAPPILNRQLSFETILAAPFTMALQAKGTLATRSLAPTVLGNLPTGVPALGTELGQITVLPPVLTAVYRFLPDWRAHPYVGVGFSYLMVMDARITNPILTEVSQPRLSVPAAFGVVVQGGVDVRVYRWFFATLDFKYIAGLDITATVTDVYVRLPKLPVYGSAKVGDNIARVSVNPIVVQAGVGMNL